MKNVHIESWPVIRYTAIVRGHDRDKASPFCRSRHGDHIRTLRRGCDRRTISGDVQTIQELFERVATVGIQLRDRHAEEMRRKVLIIRHFVVASFVRTELRFRHEYDRCARDPIKRTFTGVGARGCMYRARHCDVVWENARKFVAKSGRKTVSGRRNGDHSMVQFYR